MFLISAADTNLVDSLQQITTYFFTNVPAVLLAFIVIAVFLWFLKIALTSFGITSNSDLLDSYMGRDSYGLYPSEAAGYESYAARRRVNAAYAAMFEDQTEQVATAARTDAYYNPDSGSDSSYDDGADFLQWWDDHSGDPGDEGPGGHLSLVGDDDEED